MKERPILFSAPMVRALLAGTKTQTRRVLKVEPPPCAERVIRPFRDERLQWAATDPHDMEQGQLVLGEAPRCPYGQPGDRLWVREAWRTDAAFDALPPRDLSSTRTAIGYEAGGTLLRLAQPGKLRPGMFMPRWASRITLEVIGVRIERLQDISEADAIAEGVHADPRCRQDDDTAGFHRIGPVRDGSFPIARYGALWESLNGPGSWKSNPWVWVVEFRRLT